MKEVWCGDCLELMKNIPDGSIDAVIADPPYGTTACKWDTIIPFEPMWKELSRVVKNNGAIILFGSQPFTSALVMSNPKKFKQSIVWEKTRPTNVFNAKKQFMKWHEDLIVFYDKPPTFNPQMRTDGQFTGAKIQRENHDRTQGIMGRTGLIKNYVHQPNGGLFYPKSVIKIPTEMHTSIHPTQKPVALLEYLIKTYTNEGETVLDFTAGSGTTGVACQNLNRNFILIEKEPKYVEIIKQRLTQNL